MTRQFLLASIACAMLAGVLISAQGPARAANPPDITGEWRLDNSEDDTTAQPPLGDYTGVPFNDAGRLRSDTTAESIWGTPEFQDRKSTRLNSSHSQISYAVFCLKKKTETLT